MNKLILIAELTGLTERTLMKWYWLDNKNPPESWEANTEILIGDQIATLETIRDFAIGFDNTVETPRVGGLLVAAITFDSYVPEEFEKLPKVGFTPNYNITWPTVEIELP